MSGRNHTQHALPTNGHRSQHDAALTASIALPARPSHCVLAVLTKCTLGVLQPEMIHAGGAAGVCGDPFEGGGEAFATMAWGRLGTAGTFSPGQRVPMRVRLTANHGGRFAVQICDRTSNLDHACFNRFLTRADIPGERYWWLFAQGANYYSMGTTAW